MGIIPDLVRNVRARVESDQTWVMGDEIPNPKVLEKLEGVGNGQTGIDLALENVPDIIISDVMMPEKALRSPFLDRGKEVIALGISFSSAEKAVAEWQAVPY